MRPVSEKFLSSLRGSGGDAIQAFVVAAGQTGVSPTGTEISVIDGDVVLNANDAIRSTLDIATDSTDAFPDNADDLFAPYGNEIFVRRGQKFGGGSIEWVSLGYFRIHSVEQDDAPNGDLRVAAHDRMAGVINFRLLNPIQFPSTATYGDVVEDLIQEVYPWATVEWDDATDTDALGRSVIAEEERYDFLNDLVTSRGKIWYWDHRGVLVIKDAPSADEPVWEVNSGENGVLRYMGRSLSREGVYNAVRATSSALDTDTPAIGIAKDLNPESPTYWYGNFGKEPRYYESPFITTDAQAVTAAESILRKSLGLPYSVNFGSIVNPALEPHDPVIVKLGSKIETHIIESLTIPLTVDQAMTATTREQTLVVIGDE